jgi:hypothetical protein
VKSVAYEVFQLGNYEDAEGNFIPNKYIEAVNKTVAQGWEPISVQYANDFSGFVWHFIKEIK